MESRQYLRNLVMEASLDMSSAAQKVADFYLSADLEEAIKLNIRDAAARIGTSESTITRFTRQIGYGGYREFQDDIALALEGLERLFPVYNGIEPGSDMETVIESVTSQTILGIEDTAKRWDTDKMHELAHRILLARRVILCAGGRSMIAARGFRQRLARIGIEAEISTATMSQKLEDPVNFVSDNDVVVAFSLWMKRPAICSVLHRAKLAGAYTAAITTAGHSVDADAVIEISPETRTLSGHTNTTVNEFVASDAIYLLMLDEMGDEARRRIGVTVNAVNLDRIDLNPGQDIELT